MNNLVHVCTFDKRVFWEKQQTVCWLKFASKQLAPSQQPDSFRNEQKIRKQMQLQSQMIELGGNVEGANVAVWFWSEQSFQTISRLSESVVGHETAGLFTSCHLLAGDHFLTPAMTGSRKNAVYCEDETHSIRGDFNNPHSDSDAAQWKGVKIRDEFRLTVVLAAHGGKTEHEEKKSPPPPSSCWVLVFLPLWCFLLPSLSWLPREKFSLLFILPPPASSLFKRLRSLRTASRSLFIFPQPLTLVLFLLSLFLFLWLVHSIVGSSPPLNVMARIGESKHLNRMMVILCKLALSTFFMHVAEGKMFLLTVSEETEATPRTESGSSVTVRSFTVKTRL